jgi:hypothetical protein
MVMVRGVVDDDCGLVKGRLCLAWSSSPWYLLPTMAETTNPPTSPLDAHRETRREAVRRLRKLADSIEAQIDGDPETDPVCLFITAYDKNLVSNFGLLSCLDRGALLVGLVELQKARIVGQINESLANEQNQEPTDG